MNRMNTAACLMLAIITFGLIGYEVYAHCGKCAEDGKKIATQLDQNKMTLAKMSTAAEEHSKGRAITFISDIDDKGQVNVNVYCITGDATAPKIMMCNIDTTTGKVKAMKEVQEFPNPPHAGHTEGSAPGGSAMMIKSKQVEAGCGACVYKMSGVQGCPLAVVIDGTPYLVQGATWPNHDYCERRCQAVVTGTIENGKFIATSVEPKS